MAREAAAEIDRGAPLRLSKAAEIAFPDGSMSAAGLRREAARGRLDIRRVAGRDYTTLRAIDEMLELCRVQPKAHGSISDVAEGARPSGKFAALESRSAQAAAKATVQALRDSLRRNSRNDTAPAAQVVPIRRG